MTIVCSRHQSRVGSAPANNRAEL